MAVRPGKPQPPRPPAPPARPDAPRAPDPLARIAETLAHKMRNPLGSIQASADVLERVLGLEGEEAALLEVIRKDVRRLALMVSDLALYGSAPRLRTERAALLPAAREALDLIPATDPVYRDVDLRLDAPEDLAVPADREALVHILLNLLLNAFEAVGRRGAVSLTGRLENGAVAIEIADTGPGFGKDGLAAFAEPFRSTKRARPGLGLFAARRLAEACGGSLTASDAPGGGAILRLRFPAERPSGGG